MIEVIKVRTPLYPSTGRVGLIAVSDYIFAIGGVSGSSNNLSSVEVFDPENQSWSSAPPMRCHHGAVNVALMPSPT